MLSMVVSKYRFGGFVLELLSDEPIEKERNFSLFRCDEAGSHYSCRIIKTDALPERKGNEIFSSIRRTVISGDREQIYTAYFDADEKSYRDYACKVDDRELYILKNERLRELTVFDALNLPSVLLKAGIGILHCSFVDLGGEALLFAGEKQVGKSTQARLWKEHRGCDTVNGDRAAVSISDGRVSAHGIPFNGTSGICKNLSLPLRAIVLPSIGTENCLKRLSMREAVMQLFGKFHYDVWDEVSFDTLSSLMEGIVNSVPVYSYPCLKERSAVDTLAKELGL